MRVFSSNKDRASFSPDKLFRFGRIFTLLFISFVHIRDAISQLSVRLLKLTAETLQKMILKEHIYKYGEKLPNENELSAKLGISRTTLREAIRILASDGLLEVRRGLGTFVAQPLNQYAEGSIDFQEFSKLKITLRDLYETRDF